MLEKCVEHHGHLLHNGLAWKDGEGHCRPTRLPICLLYGLSRDLRHFKENGALGNICDYSTSVVTLRDLISLQRVSLELRNSCSIRVMGGEHFAFM